MYHVARTLVALSNKGVLIALATSFALFFTLGYFITMWIFYVPLALMCLRFAFIAKTVLSSAMKIDWPQTFEELMSQIQLVQSELNDKPILDGRWPEMPERSLRILTKDGKPKLTKRCYGPDGSDWNPKETKSPEEKPRRRHYLTPPKVSGAQMSAAKNERARVKVELIRARNEDISRLSTQEGMHCGFIKEDDVHRSLGEADFRPKRPKLRLVSNGDTNDK